MTELTQAQKESQVSILKKEIDECKRMLRVKEAFHRLHKSDDFKIVFTEDLFREEALKLVRHKFAPSVQKAKLMDGFATKLDMISMLHQHFSTLFTDAADVLEEIEALENSLLDVEAGVI